MNFNYALKYWKKICGENVFCVRCPLILICQGARRDIPETWSDQVIDDLTKYFTEVLNNAERN